MKIIQNIRFIQQSFINGCCPASINIVLDYYGKKIILEQTKYFNMFNNHGGSFFKAAESIFNNDPNFNKEFEFKSLNTSDKKDWENKIKSNVYKDIPILISSKNSIGGHHITVIWGYNGDTLFQICPENGFNSINIYDDVAYSGTDLLIIEKI